MASPVLPNRVIRQQDREPEARATNSYGLPLFAPLSSFIGREREIDSLVDLLRQDDVRLVTLTGPGGVGKTRLALQVADRLRPAFPDGVTTVSLAPIRDPELVLSAIAQTLGLRDTSDLPIAQQLADALRDRAMLLVLDNFEHVVDLAPEIAALLSACSHLKALVTSRFVLRVSGEHDVAVGPLHVPPANSALAISAITALPAMQLFVQRAHAASSDFTLSDSNAATVAEICRSVDGLPLAIELAAARVAHLPLPTLLARLDRHLSLLTGGARDQPARQQTIRNTIAWSYDLLTLAEQSLFRRLSVFVGGFTLEAAEAIAGDSEIDLLDTIGSLADKSLLRIASRYPTESRYLILESVRQFGEEKLEAEGEADAARAAHAAHFVAFVDAVAPGFDGAKTVEQRAALRADLDNCRAALDWFYQRGDAAGLLRLTRPLVIFWQNFGPWSECTAWTQRALSFEQPPSLSQGEILVHLGSSAGYQGDFAQGKRWLTQARDVGIALGELYIESVALTVLGAQLADQHCYAEGESHITDALTKARQANRPFAEALALAHLGVAVWGLGRIDEAESHLECARTIGNANNYTLPVAVACRYLGLIAAESGDPSRAAERLRESGDFEGIEELPLTRALPNLATLAVACGLHEPAVQLLGAADTVNRITRFVPAWPERGAQERALAHARTVLGERAAAAAFKTGQTMTNDEIWAVINDVFAAAENRGPRGAGEQASSVSPLTPREREVLRLIVDGCSNAEIGERLFISARTAQTHVTNILAKLGVSTRTQAAALAIREGLD
jgi:predicted ATPase/DNA-binding CsgD family transcriptional regulator